MTAPATWVALDVETTGLHPVRDRIVEIALVRLGENVEKIDEWSTLINPGNRATGGRIHGIRASQLTDAPTFPDVVDELLSRVAGAVIVAHNAPFDVGFLQAETIRAGVAWGPVEGLCTMEVLHRLGISKSRKLHQCCSELDLWAGREHVALDDARAVAAIMAYLAPRLWAIERPPAAPSWPDPAQPVRLVQRPALTDNKPIAEVGRHFRLPRDLGIPETAATTYLGLLDMVIEDGRVTHNEREALELFSRSCGINRDIARKLHLAYLEEMSRVAQADGVVTPEEQEYISNLVPLLTIALPR
jgi:DNA polymerase-3 subunit epsilon